MMARLKYGNGDEIALAECGCDGCSPCMVNGVLCHESGCPEAWRDHVRECRWCGCEFRPGEAGQEFCDVECAEAY